MPKPDDVQSQILLAELDLHKTEFAALREEILQWLDAERQYLNWTLAAVAGVLGFAPLVIEQRLYVIMLLVPFIFHVMLWEMLNALKAISRLSSYLLSTLIPRVNVILDELGSDRDGLTILGWEAYASTIATGPSSLFWSSVTPTRYWVPILTIGGLIITYGFAIRSQGYTPSLGEVALVLLNVVLLIFAATQNIRSIRLGQVSVREFRKAQEASRRRLASRQQAEAPDAGSPDRSLAGQQPPKRTPKSGAR